MSKKEASTPKAFIILTSVTIFEKVISFVFQAMIAAFMGATIITDSYFTAAEFMTLIDSTLFNGLVIALLNQYTYKQKNDGQQEALNLLTESNFWLLMISVIVAALVFVGASPLTYILAPGFDAYGKSILIRDIRIISFVPIFIAISSCFLVILRQNKDFLVVGLKSLFISTTGILLLMIIKFTDGYNFIPLSVGQLISSILYFISAWIGSRKYNKFSFLSRPKWGDEQRIIVKMWLPLIISNGISRVALMVDRVIASNLQEGSISCLTYAHSLYNFVHAILVLNLCMILLSDFTNYAAEKKTDQLKTKISNALKISIYILGVITILILFFSSNIVSIVYGRGNFNKDSVLITGQLLFYYSLCLIPSAVNNIFLQVHYAFGKTLKTMIISLISIGFNIIFSFVLTRFWGLKGVAIGTFIATLLMFVLYRYSIKKLIEDFKGIENKKHFYSYCIITFLSCAIISIFSRILIQNLFISFVIATFISGIVAVAIILMFKEPIALSYRDIIKNKLRR